MSSWIALLVSTISLLVTIIVQRDKLAEAIKDFRFWRNKRDERRKAQEIIAKFDTASEPPKEIKGKIPFKRFFLVIVVFMFLPLAICSGVANILNISTMKDMIIIGATPFALLFLAVLIMQVIEDAKAKNMLWYEWFLLVFLVALYTGGSAIFGAIWAGIALLIVELGLPILWSNIVSAILTSLVLGLWMYAESTRPSPDGRQAT